MRHMLARAVPRPGFLRNVAILTGGTIFAQAVMAATLPILTRLYSPAEFNILAVYISLIGIVGVGASLRFNIAIPLPESDCEAMELLVLALAAAAGLCLVLFLLIILFPEAAAGLIGQPAMRSYLWLVPLGVFLAAAYDAAQYWASRKKRFGLVTRTRITRALGGGGSQLAWGVIAPSSFGLVFGQMIYSGVGTFGLLRSMLRFDRPLLTRICFAGLWKTALAYQRYPKFSVPEAVLNTAGNQLPIIMIAAAAPTAEAGYLMLAMQVMGMPMALVGSSIAQVYLAEAPARMRDGELVSFTRQTMKHLFRVGAPILLLAGLLSPFGFPLIFGANWARAGILVAWLTPWFILQFVSSPVSMILHVTGNVKSSMLLQMMGCLIRIGSLLTAIKMAPLYLSETFAVFSAVFYATFIAIIYLELRKAST